MRLKNCFIRPPRKDFPKRSINLYPLMIIYEPSDSTVVLDQLRLIAPDVTRHLFPCGAIMESQMDADSYHLLVQNREKLCDVAYYAQDLGNEVYEHILRSAAELEAKRKAMCDPECKEIGLYWFASDFSAELLERIPWGLVPMCLYQLRLIKSQSSHAVVIQQVRHEICKTPSLESVQNPRQAETNGTPQIPKQEMSTPELIAVTRFGMELRRLRDRAAESN